jgi:hypothetical protein
VTVAGAGVCALAAGTVAAVDAWPTGADRVDVRPQGGAGPAATSGLDWLLSPQQYASYTGAHPSPSAAPESVHSPAPTDAELEQLRGDIAAALPADATTLRTDAADGGAKGFATVWLRLADGTPVGVERSRLSYPRVLSTTTDPSATEALAPEHFTDPGTWQDGSAYTVVTGSAWGYGFGVNDQWNGPFVWTATSDGWFTLWTAPVDADTLLGWAQAADAHFTGG